MVDYHPGEEQTSFHYGEGWDTQLDVRHKMATGGEQAGKSLSAEKELFSKLFWGRLFWVVAPDYRQARPELEYLLQDLKRIDAFDAANSSIPNTPNPWTIAVKGGIRIRSISGQDTAKIANEAPDGILMVEAAQLDEIAYHRCYGRTAPRRGWLCINGTLEGNSGWFPELARRWGALNEEGGRSYVIPSWSNRTLYPGGRQDPEILAQEAALPEDVFMERFGGVASPPRGLVCPEFSRFTHAQYNIELGDHKDTERTLYLPEDTPLQVWIDPGWNHPYAVEFAAVVNEQVYILDEVYSNHLYDEEIIELAVTNPLWGNVTKGFYDIAAEQHHGSFSAAEKWKKETGLTFSGQKVPIPAGINRLRTFLKLDPRYQPPRPRLRVSPKCSNLIAELTDQWRYKVHPGQDAQNEEPIPLHDDAAKAVIYGLVGNFKLVDRQRRNGPLPRYVPPWESRRKLTPAEYKRRLNGSRRS